MGPDIACAWPKCLKTTGTKSKPVKNHQKIIQSRSIPEKYVPGDRNDDKLAIRPEQSELAWKYQIAAK